MKLIVDSLKTGTAIAVALLALFLLAIFLPDFGIAGACAAIALGSISLKWPFPKLWLSNKVGSVGVISAAIVGLILSAQTLAENERAAKIQTQAKNEARLAELRIKDPAAYLTELKISNDPRWEREFEATDKKGYDAFLAERRAKEEQTRKESIASLLAELKLLSSSDFEAQQKIYSRLSELDPKNTGFQLKRDTLEKQITEKREAQLLLEMQQKYPERYVLLEKFSWSKEGFGNVMIANFLIKNTLPWAVKDIEIRCTHSAPSGTTIDRNTRTIFERVDASKTKRVSGFNMGFVHSQASRSGCDIISVTALR